MNPNRSGGRGELLRRLLESENSTLDSIENENTASALNKNVLLSQDSGIAVSQNPSLSTPKSGGRGRLLELIFASSSSSAEFLNKNKAVSSIEGSQHLNLQNLDKALPVIPQDVPEEEQIAVPEEERVPVIKKGKKGKPVNAICNYIRLTSDPKKGVFEYEVKFSPNVDSRQLRIQYLNDHRTKFGGTKTFDGVTLYLPILLPDKVTSYSSKNVGDGTNIEIKIIFKRKKSLEDCTHLYNVLFDRIMKTLNYVRFDRKQYDPSAPKIIPQHRLEIWPGYVTAVNEYEDGIMLCCDVSHRILCMTTVLETLAEAYRANPNNFQENAKKSLLGAVVLTRYNNKHYRIDDIDFDANPLSTFNAGNIKKSFVEYYKNQYNITIKDLKQPLLISIKKERAGNQEARFSLIPEICYLTGLRDELRSDTRVLRDIATYTRVSPNQRVQALQIFYKNVNNTPDAREILESWGLKLENRVEKLIGRQLGEEKIIFAKKQFSAGENADFNKYTNNNEMLDVVNITKWLLIHTKNDSTEAKFFLECFEKSGRAMGIEVSRPIIQVLQNDRTDAYVDALRNNIKQNTQVVVIICPTSRDDRYAAIKKICCCEIPLPSQVINVRTLRDKEKCRSIVQKIALQINCKLGGSLWSINIPLKNTMICGVDSYHDAGNKNNSVSTFVASLNDTYSNWYSRAIIQTKSEEIVNGLCVSLKLALQAYKKRNNVLPDVIIVFRDGVGDGQFKVCKEYEVPQLLEACKLDSNYNPLLTYIIVQKRINTRIFVEIGNEYRNPNPGFILDHTITRKYMYDFFLIPQSVRQGTVSPTHYVVIYDSANYSPDVIQQLTYKLCFLYYNWPGTVRVPAPCQYAHKMAYLVGQSIRKPTSELLSNKLFYL